MRPSEPEHGTEPTDPWRIAVRDESGCLLLKHQYEFRITGCLPRTVRDAFTGMKVVEVPAETVISGEVGEDRDVLDVLVLIQSLGLRLLSVRRADAPDWD